MGLVVRKNLKSPSNGTYFPFLYLLGTIPFALALSEKKINLFPHILLDASGTLLANHIEQTDALLCLTLVLTFGNNPNMVKN